MAFVNGVDETSELADILKRDIPWETYSTSRLISDKDLQLIRRYDKRTEELQSSLLDENGPAYIEAFLAVLRNVTKEETVQYVLAVLVQLLQGNSSRAKYFHQQSDLHLASTPEPYSVFLRLLQRQDWFTQEKACKLLTAVLEARPKKYTAFSSGLLNGEAAGSYAASAGPDPAEQAVASFIDWLCSQLRRPSNTGRSVPTAVGALSRLLREKGARALFLRAGGIQLLAPQLRSANNPAHSQLLYEICLCLWQLTYLKQAAEVMAAAGVIKSLVDVCRSAQKEKVFRVALSALRNLLSYPELNLAQDMLEAGLRKVVQTRLMQTWEDEDIVSSLEYMSEALAKGVAESSTFDKYKKEVLSGSLDWTPMHTSEKFWRENVEHFEDRDFQVLRVLLKLLEASREVRTLCVGCNDLAQFITYHPHGRFIVTDLRGKELVMRLMGHPDKEVVKCALLCVQKLLLTKDKLDFLQASPS